MAELCLALRWADVNWLNATLRIEKGIVRNRVDEVKTVYSGRKMAIDAEMLEALKAWRQRTEFQAESDWIFASPAMIGPLTMVIRRGEEALQERGIGH